MKSVLLTAIMCAGLLLLSLATGVATSNSRRHWRMWLAISRAALWATALFGLVMLLMLARIAMAAAI